MQNSISSLLQKFQALVSSLLPLSPSQSRSALFPCLGFGRGGFFWGGGVRRGEESREEDIVISAKLESPHLSMFLIKGYIRKFQSGNIWHTDYIKCIFPVGLSARSSTYKLYMVGSKHSDWQETLRCRSIFAEN